MEPCPFTYSNLVNVYYEQAVFCLENRRHFAAIAMLWSAAEYAIEHELWGGILLNLQTLDFVRKPVEFDAKRLKNKLKIFFSAFPALKDKWHDQLITLYESYRNTFLHAKLENLADQTLGDVGFNNLSSDKSKVPTPSAQQREFRNNAETLLIGMAETAAVRMHSLIQAFLKDLNDQVNPHRQRC